MSKTLVPGYNNLRVTEDGILELDSTAIKLLLGADLLIYSDAGSTGKAQIDGATGHIALSNYFGHSDIDDEIIAAYEIMNLADNDQRYGLDMRLYGYKTSASFTGWLSGVYGKVGITASNTQDWTRTPAGLVGVEGEIHVTTGTASSSTVTGAASFRATLTVGGAANDMVLTNYYGLYVKPNTLVGNSKLTNDYGIYVGAQAGGTTLNYAIYTAGGLVYHAGAMTLGSNLTITSNFGMAGVTPQAQQAHLADPTDLTECIARISSMLDYLEGFGMIATS